MVASRPFNADDLTRLLERFRLQQAGANATPEVNQAQLDLLLARIASLTDTLRDTEANETTRLASRLLLSDLGLVSAHFRARANEIGEALTRALEGISAEFEHAASGREQ
jgi:hypothetical protein